MRYEHHGAVPRLGLACVGRWSRELGLNVELTGASAYGDGSAGGRGASSRGCGWVPARSRAGSS
ncbi:hypothetical protein JGS22_016045 [Streptomyces sp. P38-E01]|uniref:Uncharacterized protein n=1 Tax=Streptomyces tardus TaxID=2780544 RepID=A0A949JFD3_9ACTN|nr:hypothetical protein [Streptomyces tardus]